MNGQNKTENARILTPNTENDLFSMSIDISTNHRDLAGGADDGSRLIAARPTASIISDCVTGAKLLR
jgi:hypothetical protein